MPKLIKHDAVIDDDCVLLPATAALADAITASRVIVPLPLWLEHRAALIARGDVGVWLAPTDDPARLAEDIDRLALIAIEFPKFGDGRGFSTARLLRERYGYRGELRAIGDVFRDQFFFMRECGFDAFAVRADLDPEKELAGFRVFDRTYAHSARTARPWFRERERVQ
ncbi:MAG TPA: DUF934 domain-containing protein [Casimicrobiaceae bacterium]|nr:DUF934 domain-containing protein [Casimicrobiaceae bacterium]